MKTVHVLMTLLVVTTLASAATGQRRVLELQLQPAANPPADDPFGPAVEIPLEVKKPASTPEENPAPATPEVPKTPVDPDLVRLHLQNGTVVSGKFQIKQITVDTRYGRLVVPIHKIRRFTPGISSNPQLEARITGLIENLGSNSFNEREESQKELLKIGLPIREVLQRHRADENNERSRRVKLILEELEKLAEDTDPQFDGPPETWIRRDTIETTSFTIIGTISPRQFNVDSAYGPLAVKLGDIRTAHRDVDQTQEFRKTVQVDGLQLAQRGFVNSGIRLEKGDRVVLQADGTIIMTPWGNNYSSTPDGGSNFGWYVNGKIHGGTLVAKVGGGPIFKVGSNHRFVATTTGALQLAIGMQQEYAGGNYQFPGSYNVRIKVTRP